MKRSRGIWGIGVVLAIGCSSPTERAPSLKVYRPNLNDVAIGTYPGTDGLFAVAVSDDGRYQWSFDLESWSAGQNQAGGPNLRTVSATPNAFILAGDRYRLSLCSNSLIDCPFGQQDKPGAYRKSAVCGALYYLVGDGAVGSFGGPGSIAPVKGANASDVYVGVACDAARVVIVSENDATYTGPVDGELERVAGTGKACGVGFGAGVFVQARGDGTISSSPDGKTWTVAATAQFAADACDLAFGNGTFVLTTSKGDLFTSGNGKAWSRFDYGAATPLNGVGMNDAGKMLAVGGSVAIESTCGSGACAPPKRHEILVEAIGSGDAGK